MKRLAAVQLTAAIACLSVLTSCSLGQGEPDREESFDAAGSQCTARWWLDPLVEDVSPEASRAAREALEEASVSTADIAGWKDTLIDSRSGDEELAEDELEGYAYIEAVRSDVRDGLKQAGYPDAPTRAIEVRSALDCP